MRWPFRRSDPTETAPTAEHPATAAHAADSSPGRVVTAAVPAWKSLPPIQRTAEMAMPLTAPTTALVADVHERLESAQALAPLGHEVGPLAPVGTIGLTATPIEAPTSGPDMVQRQVVRPLTAPTTATEPTSEPSNPALLPPPIAPRAVPVLDMPAAPGIQRSLISATDTLPSATGVDEAPRSGDPLPNWVESADPSGTAATLATPAVDTVIARSVASAADPQVVSGSPGTDIASRPAMPTVRRLGLGAPIASAGAGPALQRTSATPAAASPAAASAPPPPAASIVGLASRQAGGEPDSSTSADRPARVPVQRFSLTDGLPLARTAHPSEPVAHGQPMSDLPAMPLVSTPAPLDAVPIQHVDAAPGMDAGRTTHGRDDTLSLTPATSDADVTGVGPATVSPTVTTGSVIVSRQSAEDPRSRAMPVRTIRPLAGRGGEGLPIQRATGQVPSPVRFDAPVSVGRAIDQPRSADPRGLVVRTPGGSNPLPVADPGTDGALDTPPVAHPAMDIQRAPSMSTPPRVQLDLVGPRPVSGGSPRLDLQRELEVAASPSSAAAPWAVRPSAIAAGAPEQSVESPMDMKIAREATDDADAASAVQRATASSGGGATTAGGSEKDLDELARRLYDRIRLRLTRELLVDRERAGALTDLR